MVVGLKGIIEMLFSVSRKNKLQGGYVDGFCFALRCNIGSVHKRVLKMVDLAAS